MLKKSQHLAYSWFCQQGISESNEAGNRLALLQTKEDNMDIPELKLFPALEMRIVPAAQTAENKTEIDVEQ